MSVYSIKDLENFTQIKAHTLRIWEQRYKLLSPARTKTNIRLYTEDDLKKILNINLLYSNGLKISKIAKLSDEEIQKLAIENLMGADEGQDGNINVIIRFLIEFDEPSIIDLFSDYIAKYSIDYIFTNLLIPLLKKVGELWQVNTISVAHEHFLSNIIRRLFIVNTPELKNLSMNNGVVLLFLKEDEYHELGLLFYNYYLRTKGYKTVYVGAAMPMTDLEVLVKSVQPDYLFSSLVAQISEKEFQAFIDKIKNCFDLTKVYLGGFQTELYKEHIPSELKVISQVSDIDFC
ncbi:MerR family transcriptional regulator [Crocinitomix algicola]|uniref:MerR family transcriptional regulator n=1 Tax=Crocinitomix algicola TaxID=1740263 RepID=UPI000872A158|nr:MerR family transcriptional regulator [Crocinitomix algicola]